MLINTNQTQKTISSCFLYLANATYRTLKNGKSSSARCTLSFVTYSNPYLFNLDYFTGLLIYLLLSNLKFLFINPKTARILFPKDISILITALLRFSQWFLITLEWSENSWKWFIIFSIMWPLATPTDSFPSIFTNASCYFTCMHHKLFLYLDYSLCKKNTSSLNKVFFLLRCPFFLLPTISLSPKEPCWYFVSWNISYCTYNY